MALEPDSDWAGNNITKKSTIGSAMYLGKHLIKSWNTTQVMALPSGEAELCGMLNGEQKAHLHDGGL